MSPQPQQILLIDDELREIEGLEKELHEVLEGDQVDIATWIPRAGDNPDEVLLSKISPETILVITDYDLTKEGLLGFQGTNVRSLCQQKLIPVGDFSRGKPESLPNEPDLFSMRVPVSSPEHAAQYIAGVYQGFSEIRCKANDLPPGTSSISAAAAWILGRPELEPGLSLYFSRLATSNPWLRERLQSSATSQEENRQQTMIKLLSYMVGHVIQNLVLAFPGPLINVSVLAAYLAVSETDAREFAGEAELAAYTGPFCALGPYYWRSDVDAIVDRAIELMNGDLPDEESELNRFVVERVINHPLGAHNCDRDGCNGMRGGFWCPFSKRPVCSLNECSEASTAWIPDGADLCRVEKDFFDEFAPLLGL